MLTKDDLKEIRKVIREEVEVENDDTKNTLRSDLIQSRIRIQTDIKDLSDKHKNSEIKITRVEKKVDKLSEEAKKGFRDIQKKLVITTGFLDKDHLKNLERIERIERHLRLAPIS